MRILVSMPMTGEHKKEFQKVAPNEEFIFSDQSAIDEALVKSADIIVGNVPPEWVQGSKKLRLLQLNSAGTDGYVLPGILPKQATLTNATGAYGLAISEHMLAMLLTLMKKLDLYHDNQAQHKWLDCGPVTSIWGSKTLVVGLGDIGSEFAYRMHLLGSTVTAIRRHQVEKPDYIENVFQMDHLMECLATADIIAVCLPGTTETKQLFQEEAFKHMKKGAIFLNVGRGTVVDSFALCEALNRGHLGGAGIDVTDLEPLPENHPLWNAQRLVLTPHVSGGYHLQRNHDRIVEIAAKNISHCLKNEKYENVVDLKTGYRKLI